MVLMYVGLVVESGFFAWLAWRGLQPFPSRWQIILRHLCLGVAFGGAAMYVNARSDSRLWHSVLRIGFAGALIIGLLVIGHWLWIGVRNANDKPC